MTTTKTKTNAKAVYMIDGQRCTATVFARRTRRPRRGPVGYYIDGVLQPKEIYYQRTAKRSAVFGPGYAKATWKRPVASDSAAVHPALIPEAIAHDAKHGVPTRYLPDGRPVFLSAAHRRRYFEAHKLYDKNAGYGDRTKGGNN